MFILNIIITYFTLNNLFVNRLVIFDQLFAFLYGPALIYQPLFLNFFGNEFLCKYAERERK